MKLTFKLSFIFFVLLIVSGVVTLVVLLNINQRKSEVLICEIKKIENIDYQICNLENGSKTIYFCDAKVIEDNELINKAFELFDLYQSRIELIYESENIIKIVIVSSKDTSSVTVINK